MSVAVIQPELISDDPRVEGESVGVLAELREFFTASREMRGLLTPGQAGKILGVPTGAVHTWIGRGRLSSRKIVGTTMVSAVEVLALLRQRQQEALSKGGRGHKAPSLTELIETAWEDIDPLK